MRTIFTALCLAFVSLQAQNHPPIAKPDSFMLHQAASVLTNDSDPDGNKISVISYVVDGVKYSPLQGPNPKLKTKYGNVTLKATGEVMADTPILITYTISDGKYGTSTSTCKYYRKKTYGQLMDDGPLYQFEKNGCAVLLRIWLKEYIQVKDTFILRSATIGYQGQAKMLGSGYYFEYWNGTLNTQMILRKEQYEWIKDGCQ